MLRSHWVVLSPEPEQESLFGQYAGYSRLAYYLAIVEFQAGLEVGK